MLKKAKKFLMLCKNAVALKRIEPAAFGISSCSNKVCFIFSEKTKIPTPVVGDPVRSGKLGNLRRRVRILSEQLFCIYINVNFFTFDMWISSKKLLEKFFKKIFCAKIDYFMAKKYNLLKKFFLKNFSYSFLLEIHISNIKKFTLI